jgi:hypothetical protein
MDDLPLHHDTALVIAVFRNLRKKEKIRKSSVLYCSLLMNLVGSTSYWHTVAEVIEMCRWAKEMRPGIPRWNAVS